MKRAFSTLCCINYNAEEIIELAKKNNLAVELRVDDKNIESFFGKKELFENANVEITDIAASIFVISEEISENAYKYIDLAENLNVKGVRIFAGESPKTFQDEIISDIPAIIKGIKKLCEYAKNKNVEIWLETHSELSTGKLCKDVLDDVNMPNLKIIWDVLHSIEYREVIQDTIAHLGDKIVHVHLKDAVPPSNMNVCQYVHTDLGVGIMAFDEVISELKAMNFDGYYSLEWESPWRPEIRELYPDPNVLLEKYNKILDNCGE